MPENTNLVYCYGFGRMRTAIAVVIDCLMLLAGIVLVPVSFIRWKSLGFPIESRFQRNTSFDGLACLITILIGIVLICYAVFDLMLRRRSNSAHNDIP